MKNPITPEKSTEQAKSEPVNFENPLGTEKISKLLPQFAIPSIVGMLVTASYNIIDQIFIGRGVGFLGNAATNVDFPISIISLSLAMLFGMGAAIRYSIEIGAGRKENAAKAAGNGITFMVIVGLIYFAIIKLFLQDILVSFGAIPEVLPYSLAFSGTLSWGIPFSIVSIGLTHIIRADGSPRYSMMCMITGCLVNLVLAPTFIFGFHMGIKGAATATLIAQLCALGMGIAHLPKLKNTKLTLDCFKPDLHIAKSITSLGMAGSFNQLTMTIVQVVMNRSLGYWGAYSIYGSAVPLACAGLIGKVNMMFFSLVIGIAQGIQTIIGFNYGAKKYDRVKEAFKLAIISATAISCIAFLCFQIFPRQIIGLFGSGSEEYYQFAERYFRIFLLFAFINGIQPIVANFLTSVGMAVKGLLLSLTRQIFLLLPLILILPRFFGIDGIMYAGPLADAIAVAISILMARSELKKLDRLM